MEPADNEIFHALECTRVVRAPRQKLASFGNTAVRYYLVTKPAYAGGEGDEPAPESVVREGVVTAQRPAIVTPSYVMNLEGFGAEARRSFEHLARLYGKDSPGLMYTYKNEALGLNITEGRVEAVAERISSDLNSSGKDLAAVIIGPDVLWDVALLKFIYDFTAASFSENVQELQERGLLGPDPSSGIPKGAAQRIEMLFRAVEAGESDPATLKTELDRWELFSRYEDRFLSLFRRGRR